MARPTRVARTVATTLADTYDFVWKEAMAEYLTYVYEDQELSAATADTTARAWKTWASYSGYYLVPDARPPLIQYYGDVYGPGPMILFRQVERLSSREAVLAAIASLIGGEPRAIGVADVEAALEVSTGLDLGAYFDAWVYGAGAPVYPRAVVSWVAAEGGGIDVTVDVTTADGVLRGCAFTIQLRGGAGEVHDVPIHLGPGGAASVTVNALPAFVPTSYLVDPYTECLIWKGGGGKPAFERPGGPGPARPAGARSRPSIEPWGVSSRR